MVEIDISRNWKESKSALGTAKGAPNVLKGCQLFELYDIVEESKLPTLETIRHGNGITTWSKRHNLQLFKLYDMVEQSQLFEMP